MPPPAHITTKHIVPNIIQVTHDHPKTFLIPPPPVGLHNSPRQKLNYIFTKKKKSLHNLPENDHFAFLGYRRPPNLQAHPQQRRPHGSVWHPYFFPAVLLMPEDWTIQQKRTRLGVEGELS